MICPFCEQRDIVKTKVKKTGNTIFICEECDAVWKQETDIGTNNVTNFEDYAKKNNISNSWEELEII